MAMYNVEKAGIYWVNLAPTEGREIEKKRPCVIIKPLDYWELAVVIPLTSTHFTTSSYTVVRLASGTGNLRQDSAALCHHIRSVSYLRIKEKIGLFT